MQALKKELQLLVPSIRVFLDVENMTSIGSLEDLVANSETVLVFLSTGYFARYCRLITQSAAKHTPCAHTRLVVVVCVLFLIGGTACGRPMRASCARKTSC
jgi:hypothetical protein